jgi:hypothetical protein
VLSLNKRFDRIGHDFDLYSKKILKAHQWDASDMPDQSRSPGGTYTYGKRRLVTAHPHCNHCQEPVAGSQWGDIEAVKAMLANPDISVTRIALRLGVTSLKPAAFRSRSGLGQKRTRSRGRGASGTDHASHMIDGG